ncbi:MAG TPA: RDD family protein [Terriglobales bacterium]|nr:RDD family protein [Terriglobales bacterium]
MACPVCPGICRCGGNDAAEPSTVSEHVAVVIDPEHYDFSEESFAAGERMASAGVREPDARAQQRSVAEPLDNEPDVATALEAAARSERLAQLRPARRTIVLVEPNTAERPLEPGEWRREVSSRVNRYRARRRPRVERPRSLGLNFEPAPPSSSAPAIPIRKEIATPLPSPFVDPELSLQPGEPEASAVEREQSAMAQQQSVANPSIAEPLAEPGRQMASAVVPANETNASAEELTAMQIELYGVERYWPNVAPRNQKPFWKHDPEVAQFQPVSLQAIQFDQAQEDLEAQDDLAVAKDVIIIKDDPVPVETPVIFSEQFDGSIISDLTEAVFAAEQPVGEDEFIEAPVTLTPVAVSPIQTNIEPDEELADPVMLSPHVFEEEEINLAELAAQAEVFVEPAPPIALVELSAAPESTQPPPGMQALLLVAPIYLRATMEAVDFCVSGTGFLLFGFILLWAGVLPEGKAFTIMSAILPGFFWALYQYLFLVNTGSTPGMRLAGLRLTSFEGDAVSPSRRRARALSIGLSTFALGLGFLWVLLDEDHLCWHDRASKTFVTRERPEYVGNESV